MGFQKLQGRGGVHLGRDDAGQIVFCRHLVDGGNLSFVYHQTQGAEEGLCFLTFQWKLMPMITSSSEKEASSSNGVKVSSRYTFPFQEIPPSSKDTRCLPDTVSPLARNLALSVKAISRH